MDCHLAIHATAKFSRCARILHGTPIPPPLPHLPIPLPKIPLPNSAVFTSGYVQRRQSTQLFPCTLPAGTRAQAAGNSHRAIPSSRAATGTVVLDFGYGSAALYYNSANSSRATRIFPGARRCARRTSRSGLSARDTSQSNRCLRGFAAAAAGPQRTQPRSLGCGSAALCSARLGGSPALAGLNCYG